MSKLVEHAQRELKIAGWPMAPRTPEGEFDYDHEVVKSVLQLVQVFADQHHSGLSASLTLNLTSKLLEFEALTPLTDNPEEWQETNPGMWQNRRQSDSFSQDGGKTYYRLDEKRKWVYRLYFRVPNRFRRSVWNKITWLIYPKHHSVKFVTESLDKVGQVA